MHAHSDAVSGSILGALTSLPLASGDVHVPDGAPWWAGYVATLLVALAPIVVKAIMSNLPKSAPRKPPAPCPPKPQASVGGSATSVAASTEVTR